MNCRDVRPLLARYVDGETDGYEKTLIQQHLAECQACSAEVSQLRVMHQRVKREIKRWAASAVPSASAWERLMAKLAAEKETQALPTMPGTSPNTILNKRATGRFVLIGLVTGVLVAALILTFRSTPVTQDMSASNNTVLVDDLTSEHVDLLLASISRAELVKRFTTAYLLKRVPDGFTLKITAPPKPSANDDFFLIDYRNKANEYFLMQSVDAPGSFSDMKVETHTFGNGLTLHILDDRTNDDTAELTSGVVDSPNGDHFLLASNLPREQVKTWIENLVLATS